MNKILAGMAGVVIFTAAGASAQTETAQLEIQARAVATTSSAKGNVEFNWKVEEGEKAGPALLEIDTIKGESPERDKKGEKGGTEDINIGVGELQEGKVNKVDSITVKQGTSMKGGVSVAAGDIDGLTEEEKAAFLASVKAHAQVQSEQDLENVAKGVLIKDDNVDELSSDDDSVEVKYRVPAKFLGMFETSLPVTVVAARAKGGIGAGVKVHFPWFGFLFKKHESLSSDSIETDIGTAVGADLRVEGELDLSTTAKLYGAISNVMKTKHDAAISI